MKPISRAAFQSISSAYQRDMMIAVLPMLAAALLIGLGVLYLISSNLIPPTRTIWLAVPALAFAQTYMIWFRHIVNRVSRAHNFVCSSCDAPLGLSYQTLKRAGKCRKCGAQVVDAA